MFQQESISVPILGLVENMAGYVCESCGTENHPMGVVDLDTDEILGGLPRLASIPISREMAMIGRPIGMQEKPSPLRSLFDGIARAVVETGDAGVGAQVA